MKLAPTSLPFMLKRLRAMSAAEVVYRLRKNLQASRDQRRLSALHGESKIDFMRRHRLITEPEEFEIKQALLYQKVRGEKIFPWQKVTQPAIAELFDTRYREKKNALLCAAEKLLDQRFTIFDKEIVFQQEIQWNMDPLTHNYLPELFWTKIDYRNPRLVREVKYVWELNRLQHFVTLGKAYYLTGEERYADNLFLHWRDWLTKNPYLVGINWTSALECAFRLISWTWALQFAKPSAAFVPEFYPDILVSVEQHANYIEKNMSRFSSANNHLIGEAVGLIYAGCYYPELSRAQQWRKTGFDVLQKEILLQTHDDGVIREQTSYYQRYLLDFCSLALVAAEFAGYSFSGEFLKRLEKMADFLAALMDHNGHVPHIGDDDGGEAVRLTENPSHKFIESVATIQALLKVPLTVNRVDNEVLFWMTGKVGGDDQAAELSDPNRAKYFYDGGYVIWNGQMGDHRHHMVFDVGPQGFGKMAAHGHADALNLLLHIDGLPVLIDSGTFLYLGAGQLRDYFRGTAAHNTVTVDGHHQAEPVGPFQWGRKVEATVDAYQADEHQLSVTAHHNGYEHMGITHSRKVERGAKDEWIITDRIEGSGHHKIELFFHLSECNFSEISAQFVHCDFGQFHLAFHFSGNKKYKMVVIDSSKEIVGWHSERFGHKDRHPVLKLTTDDALPVELNTIIRVQ